MMGRGEREIVRVRKREKEYDCVDVCVHVTPCPRQSNDSVRTGCDASDESRG